VRAVVVEEQHVTGGSDIAAEHVPAGDDQIVAGFQLGRGYSLDAYDEDCATAGLELAERWATWDREPFTPTSDYAVSVHRSRST